MPKLKPLSPTSTQIERIKKEPIGSGFFVFRANETQVELVPFVLGATGQLLKPDGSPLTYAINDAGDYVLYTVIPNLIIVKGKQ